MPSISSCPTCHRDLTIPDLAERQKLLRCPLCDAQFNAEEALADSVKFPPAAIIVDAADSHGASAAPEVAEQEPERPQYLMTGDAGAEAPEYEARLFTDAPQTIDTEERTEMREEPVEADAPLADSSQDAPSREAPEAGTTEASPQAENGGVASEVAGEGADYESFGRQVASMRVAPKVRRQTSPLGALGQFAGMALGGVLGLAIGYYVLIWIGGSQADFLELRGKLPRWLRPPAGGRNSAPAPGPLTKHNSGRDEAAGSIADPFLQAAAPAAHTTTVTADDDAVDNSDETTAELTPAETAEPASVPSDADPTLVERLPATTKPLPESYRGPKGFRLRTAADLETALEETELALRCPRCQKPGVIRLASYSAANEGEPAALKRPCDYCRGKPLLHLTAAGFAELCELAETVTFVQFEPDDDHREQLRDAAESILMAIGGQRDKCDMVGRLAGERLEDSARQVNGIILAGAVQEAQSQGDLFAMRVLLFGSGKPVTIVSRQPPEPPLDRRDRAVVLGSIVDSPAENLAGYSGTSSQVVWGGLHFKLVP
ncbi:MAG TPA: hypothetical protein VFI31_03220 [Pirellulales bacterium]|nr:hypothetical protein [Pirellulales bacterium]